MSGPMTCEKCRFFKVEDLTCHRYPPTPAEVAAQDYWPRVDPSDFCGEFQPWPEMEEKP